MGVEPWLPCRSARRRKLLAIMLAWVLALFAFLEGASVFVAPLRSVGASRLDAARDHSPPNRVHTSSRYPFHSDGTQSPCNSSAMIAVATLALSTITVLSLARKQHQAPFTTSARTPHVVTCEVTNPGVLERDGPVALAGTSGVCERPLGFGVTRGSLKTTSLMRGNRLVAHVKWKPTYRKERKEQKTLAFSKTFRNPRHRGEFRIAIRAVMHKWKMQRNSRRVNRWIRAKNWRRRVAANSKLHGVRYSMFKNKMKEANILLSRRILSDLGIYDRPIFTNVMELAVPNWRDVLAFVNYDRWSNPEMSLEEKKQAIDDKMIPMLEKNFPGLYTDPRIRFNRQADEHEVHYTVDFGDPEAWRRFLPKRPEFANFEMPDHLMEFPKTGEREYPLELVYEEMCNQPLEDVQVLDKDMASLNLKKEGKENVSRESWWDNEPQSWF